MEVLKEPLWDGLLKRIERFSLTWKEAVAAVAWNSNLVDSASSHTLVSKIKPCMSKYKRIYTVKLRTAH